MVTRFGIIGASLAAGLLAAAAPAAAQQQPPRPAGRPAAPAQAQAQPPAAAGPAQPAAPAAQPGQTAPPQPQPIRTEIVSHDNWTVTCREFADKKRSCSGLLQVMQSQNNQVVFAWLIGRNAEGKLMSVLQTPTGIAIAPGVDVKLSKGPNRKANYVNCETNRCEATLDLDDAFAKEAAGTENVEATIFSTAGQGVKFTLPFKGFDKAVAALR